MKKPAEIYATMLKDLGNTMLGVARESVSLLKRTDQQQTLKLTRHQEWEVYLEFLRVQFNLVDRLSAFYIPVQDQPEFMNALEDSVADQLKTVLAPTLSSSEVDEMEVIMAIGQTVSESRKLYEQFRFVVTEQSKERDSFFQFFGERVAGKIGSGENKELASAAHLCASAVIPALQLLFEDTTKPATSSAASEKSAEEGPRPFLINSSPESEGVPTIKLVTVLSRISEEEVETWWGVHPRFQRDLPSHEAKELAQHMNRVTRIVGERFAVVASLAQSKGDEPQGHA